MKIFFTPGPSQLYPTVKKHLADALKTDLLSMSHRSNEFFEMYAQTEQSLRELLNIPKTHAIFFVNSATEAMDITIRNCVEKKSFHIVNGAFGKRFFQSAQETRKQAEKFDTDLENIVPLDAVKIPAKSELICLTETDTSVGMSIPLEEIYDLKKKNPDILIAVDTVASMPYVDLDYSLLDSVFFSVQKGFGLPAGLAVMIVSPDALAKAKHLKLKGCDVGTHHGFIPLKTYADKRQTLETPNVLALYLLGKVAKDMQTFGVKKLRSATVEKAKKLYCLLERSDAFAPVIVQKKYQAPTVIVAKFKKDILEELRQWQEKTGMIIGKGYGEKKDTQMRIANFFATQVSDVERLIEMLCRV